MLNIYNNGVVQRTQQFLALKRRKTYRPHPNAACHRSQIRQEPWPDTNKALILTPHHHEDWQKLLWISLVKLVLPSARHLKRATWKQIYLKFCTGMSNLQSPAKIPSCRTVNGELKYLQTKRTQLKVDVFKCLSTDANSPIHTPPSAPSEQYQTHTWRTQQRGKDRKTKDRLGPTTLHPMTYRQTLNGFNSDCHRHTPSKFCQNALEQILLKCFPWNCSQWNSCWAWFNSDCKMAIDTKKGSSSERNKLL